MNKLRIVPFALSVLGSVALCAQSAAPVVARQPSPGSATAAASQSPKVMREFRGIKLGMKPDEVHTAMGKPGKTDENIEEFSLGGDDLLTINYDNGTVKAIRLYFTDAKKVPAWTEVVGDTEIKQNDSGAKFARRVEENFWVSMFQNKDGTVTTITISH